MAFSDIRENLFEDLIRRLREENLYYRFRVNIPKSGKALKFRGILIYKIMLASNKWKNEGIAVPANLPQSQLDEIGGERFKRWTGCKLTTSNYYDILNILVDYAKQICRTKYIRKRRKPKTFKGHNATLSYDRKEKTLEVSPTAKEDIHVGDLIALEHGGTVRKALQGEPPNGLLGIANKYYKKGEIVNVETGIQRDASGGDFDSEITSIHFNKSVLEALGLEEVEKKEGLPNKEVKRIPKKRKI